MRRFAITLTSKGQVTLPAEYRRMVDARPGDRLALIVDEAGNASLRKADDDLSRLKAIGRRAKTRHSQPQKTSADPIGDFLVVEDDRIRGARK
jgi:AbrB family looped-hinge helix DNA binding protein